MFDFKNYSDIRQGVAELHIGQTIGDVRLQTLVRVDSSHSFLSSAKIEVWHQPTMSWNRVSHLIEVPCDSYLTVKDACAEAAEELLVRAVELLELG